MVASWFSLTQRVLVVVHTENKADKIRILSARKATRSEAREYKRRR